MTPTKWFASFLILGLLLIGGALFFFRGSAPMGLRPTAATEPLAKGSDAKNVQTAPSMKRVVDLYESESRRVGKIDPDPKATQKRLEVEAAALKPEEILWLETQAMDAKTNADAKFFAVYMMGLSHQKAALESLGRIAASPIPASKNERIVDEERAKRAQSIEGVSLLCKDFPEDAKDQLLNAVDAQRDEFLREYAHRGLYACLHGKPIEEQDKDALRKLRAGSGGR